MTSIKAQVVSGVKWTGTSALVSTILHFGQLAILARILHPGDFGLMAIVNVVIGFALQIADIGLTQALIQRKNPTDEEFASLYWLNVVSGALLFGITCLAAPLIADLYNEPRLRQLIPLTGAVFLVSPIGQPLFALLHKRLEFRAVAAIEIGAALVGTGTAVACALLGSGVYALVWAQLAVAVTRTSASVLIGGPKSWPRFRLSFQDTRSYLAFGLFQVGGRLLGYVANNMDKMLIGKLLGAQALGYFGMASQLMQRPLQIINPVMTKVAFPVFSSIQDQDARLRNGYTRILEVVAFLNLPIYFGLWATAEPLVQFLLGDRWSSAVAPLQVLAVLGILWSLGNPMGSLILSKGKANWGFAFNVLKVGLVIPCIVIGSRWGLVGVAFGLLLPAAIVLAPLEFAMRWWLVRMTPWDYVRPILPFFSLSLMMGVVVHDIDLLLPALGPASRFAILVFAGAGIYSLGVWLIRRDFLREIISLVRSRAPLAASAPPASQKTSAVGP